MYTPSTPSAPPGKAISDRFAGRGRFGDLFSSFRRSFEGEHKKGRQLFLGKKVHPRTKSWLRLWLFFLLSFLFFFLFFFSFYSSCSYLFFLLPFFLFLLSSSSSYRKRMMKTKKREKVEEVKEKYVEQLSALVVAEIASTLHATHPPTLD